MVYRFVIAVYYTNLRTLEYSGTDSPLTLHSTSLFPFPAFLKSSGKRSILWITIYKLITIFNLERSPFRISQEKPRRNVNPSTEICKY
jgi:hypothetical protein